ncbi:MAG TPA: hypothetical protein V6D31_04250 [Candidatus Sericytochromatia bacterium]
MTSSLNRVDEILALDKPQALICAIESASGAILLRRRFAIAIPCRLTLQV